MKKTFLTIVAVIAASSIYAQQVSQNTEETSFKPLNNNWATELNINPFKNDVSANNSLNQIKFRKFISERTALRLGFGANRISSDIENSNPYGTNPTIYREEKSSTTLGVNIGFEKHFSGTKRLSPYIGVDLAFSDKSSKQEINRGANKTTVKGGWASFTYATIPNPNYNGTNGQYITQAIPKVEEAAYTRYGMNLISGFDYYISKHFFLGAEFNIGFNQTNYKDLTYKTAAYGNTPSQNNDNTDQKNNSFQVGTSSYNGIRLGYIF